MKTTLTVFLFVLMITIISGMAAAQERGQYLPGFRGLNAAEQPGEGFTYANYFAWYPAKTIKDRDGNKLRTDFDLDLIADTNLFAYTPKKKVLGATYTASVAVPILNTAITIPRIGVDVTGTAGIGDVYFEPLSLAWAMKKGKVRAAYGFVAPTGAKRTTSDYWGHQVSFGGVYNPEKTKMWQISLSSVWEFHHTKRHSDVRVGNNVTFEYGVGKTFIRNKGAQIYQLGLVGYSEFQLSNDSGTAVSQFNLGAKDRVFAFGPEFDMILPAKKLNFLVRILPEFGARSRTQGVTVFIALAKTF